MYPQVGKRLAITEKQLFSGVIVSCYSLLNLTIPC